MRTDAVLINGVSLPYHVLDKAIKHVIANQHNIKVVLIYQNSDDDDRYSVPSDIELTKAEFSQANAEKNLLVLIQHNAQFAKTYFERHKVNTTTMILANPSMDQISEAVGDADKIFIDPETFKYPQEFAFVNYTYEEFDEQFSFKLEWTPRQ